MAHRLEGPPDTRMLRVDTVVDTLPFLPVLSLKFCSPVTPRHLYLYTKIFQKHLRPMRMFTVNICHISFQQGSVCSSLKCWKAFACLKHTSYHCALQPLPPMDNHYLTRLGRTCFSKKKFPSPFFPSIKNTRATKRPKNFSGAHAAHTQKLMPK